MGEGRTLTAEALRSRKRAWKPEAPPRNVRLCGGIFGGQKVESGLDFVERDICVVGGSTVR
jgi:hypothetical protein